MEMNGEIQRGILENGHRKTNRYLSKISIVIPMYNVETCISDCITSIMKQTYTNFEIIMINDGSTDRTEDICLELSKKNSKIHYYYQENLGAGAARNKGMKMSKGDYLAFIDADDYVHPTYLEELYSLIIKFNTKIACCSYIKGLKKDINIFIEKMPSGGNIRFNRQEALANLFYRKEIAGYPYVKLIDANLAKKIKFPINLRIGEDFVFVYETLKHVNQVAYTSKQLYFYVQNQEGITHNLTVIDMKMLWHQISFEILNEMQEESEVIKKAIRSKLFILAYDFLVKLNSNVNEKEFKYELTDYLKKNRKKIAEDISCKKSNRILGVLCCMNINLVVKMGCFFTKMNWNLKRAL